MTQALVCINPLLKAASRCARPGPDPMGGLDCALPIVGGVATIDLLEVS